MTKDEIVDAAAAKTGVSKKDAEGVVNAVLETITKTLVEGGKVALTGFGTFSVNRREARTGVNPQHPEQKIQIPADECAKI